MGVMDNTPTGKMIRTMLFAFAEFERDMIVERTSEGKRFKRETDPDYREGRKKQDVPGFPALYQAVKDDNITVSEAISQLGITKSKWYRLVKEAA
jgi:DNA invertase Pin-like site-specific DNA recombinase